MLQRDVSHWRRMVVTAALAGASWHSRALGPSAFLGPLCFALPLPWMVRRASGDRDRDAVLGEFLMGHMAAGLLSLGLLVGGGHEVAAGWAVQLLTAAAGFAANATLVNLAWVTSAAWASRALAMGLVSCSLVSGSHWMAALALAVHLTTLGSRGRRRIDTCAAPPYAIGTQALWDQFRSFTLTLLWKAVVYPLAWACNRTLPRELRVFAMDIPVFDMGDLGVAAMLCPGDALPKYVVCNVGHIDLQQPAGMSDMQRTMNTVRDVWGELRGRSGLIANVVCLFPRLGSVAKEVNLSAWESKEAARDWYMSSEGHNNIMRQHTSGYLRTFGNLLSSLEPRMLRHQGRCSRCARVVEAEVGRAPDHCGVCGAKTFQYPGF